MLFLSGCEKAETLEQFDERVIRTEFSIPGDAQKTFYRAVPKTAGTFGREGLKIDMNFQFPPEGFERYLEKVRRDPAWSEMPIPPDLIMRIGSIRKKKDRITSSLTQSGKALPPDGSADNPTIDQISRDFVATLPVADVGAGYFSCKHAGDNLMKSKRVTVAAEGGELNDFMLGVLDTKTRTLRIRVSTDY